jgi:GT2 family glycosyltransferase
VKQIRFDQEVGLSNARNYGISLVEDGYIAFLDDDAIADRNWLEEVRKGIDEADILGGPIRPIYQVPPPKWWNEKVFGFCAGVGNWTNGEIWGTNLVVRKEVFRAVGLFNPNIGRQKEKLLSFEEIDFIDRAQKSGFRVRFMPLAVVYHKVASKRMTLAYILRWNYYAGKSKKAQHGYRPSRTCRSILMCILDMINPQIITSEKSTRIRKIAWMVALLGELF